MSKRNLRTPKTARPRAFLVGRVLRGVSVNLSGLWLVRRNTMNNQADFLGTQDAAPAAVAAARWSVGGFALVKRIGGPLGARSLTLVEDRPVFVRRKKCGGRRKTPLSLTSSFFPLFQSVQAESIRGHSRAKGRLNASKVTYVLCPSTPRRHTNQHRKLNPSQRSPPKRREDRDRAACALRRHGKAWTDVAESGGNSLLPLPDCLASPAAAARSTGCTLALRLIADRRTEQPAAAVAYERERGGPRSC